MNNPPFETIVERHGRTILRVCRSLLAPADADDAWSETFLAALRAYPDLAEDSNVEAWLVRIAHRKAVDVARAKARSPVPVDDVPEPERPAEVPRERLWEAIRELPPKQRRAVVYRHIAGLAYDDIANILEGTPDSARRAVADGIRTLRRIYPAMTEQRGDDR